MKYQNLISIHQAGVSEDKWKTLLCSNKNKNAPMWLAFSLIHPNWTAVGQKHKKQDLWLIREQGEDTKLGIFSIGKGLKQIFAVM